MSTSQKKLSKTIVALLIISIMIICDQYTKAYVLDYFFLKDTTSVEITNFLNLTFVLNKGISFGLFNNGIYSNYLFLFLAIVVTLLVIYLLIFENSLLSQISYSLIIGGAIGNIIDRCYNGAVLDFIELHISHYYWPAFNVADSSICLGAFLLLYDMFINGLKIKSI